MIHQAPVTAQSYRASPPPPLRQVGRVGTTRLGGLRLNAWFHVLAAWHPAAAARRLQSKAGRAQPDRHEWP